VRQRKQDDGEFEHDFFFFMALWEVMDNILSMSSPEETRELA
jgi:hypothetical protein